MANELMNYEKDFQAIMDIIEKSKLQTMKVVNTELIEMYWQIGKYISEKTKTSDWGKGVVKDFAEFFQKKYPFASGFSSQNLWRMKQFYETYYDDEKLSPLVREITWSNNLLIMANCKTAEAREFYLKLCIANCYGKRELQRQIDSMFYEREMLSSSKHKELIAQVPAIGSLRDSYVLEFLDVPNNFKEKDLRKSIIANLKSFILEFGKDFSFVGEEYKVQVGNNDYYIDLLFFNRALACLVAIELKVGPFKPEHLGQLNFYLEALDRQEKKKNENPSVGIVLCSGKNEQVVEYAMSRTISPTMVSQYTLNLIDKKLLENKLKEISKIIEENNDN